MTWGEDYVVGIRGSAYKTLMKSQPKNMAAMKAAGLYLLKPGR